MKKLTYRSTVSVCKVGNITQAVNNNLSPILFIVFQDKFGLSPALISTLILLNFTTQLLVDIVAIRLVDRIGYRASMLIASGFAALGLFALGFLPGLLPNAFVGLAIAAVVYAVGGGFIEVVTSPIVDAIPSEAKASSMALLHSFYSWGQLLVVIVSTAFIRIFGADFWYLLPMLWAILPTLNFFFTLAAPMPKTVAAEEKTKLGKLLRSPMFIVAMVIMICSGATELVMAQWVSLFAEKGLGMSKFVGDMLGTCMFALFMALGRTGYGLFGKKMNMKKTLVVSAIGAVACYLVASLAINPYISIIGCALCGLAVSLMWPGMFVILGEAFPKGGAAMFGVLALLGDIGCCIGPSLTGFISDGVTGSAMFIPLANALGIDAVQLGMRTGLLTTTIFPLLLLIGLFIFIRHHKTHSAEDFAANASNLGRAPSAQSDLETPVHETSTDGGTVGSVNETSTDGGTVGSVNETGTDSGAVSSEHETN